MSDHENGVVKITIREMYDLQSEMVKSINRLESKFERFEEKLNVVNDVDERSREALDIANDALEKANEALDKIEQSEKEKKDLRQKYMVSIVAAISPYIFGAIIAIIYLLKDVK